MCTGGCTHPGAFAPLSFHNTRIFNSSMIVLCMISFNYSLHTITSYCATLNACNPSTSSNLLPVAKGTSMSSLSPPPPPPPLCNSSTVIPHLGHIQLLEYIAEDHLREQQFVRCGDLARHATLELQYLRNEGVSILGIYSVLEKPG